MHNKEMIYFVSMKITTWTQFLEREKQNLYFSNLLRFVDEEYKHHFVFPKREDLFKCFDLTPFEEVKVVILGQDPYHREGQAMGLAFSVPEGVVIPPSLRNIFKEMAQDLEISRKFNGDLTYLAKQGVLLLNTILTVREGMPLSHDRVDYKKFTSVIMKELNSKETPVVFILWGANARSFKKYITGKQHLILEGNHPSPLSANMGGFFNGKYFTKTNEFLVKNKIEPIDW